MKDNQACADTQPHGPHTWYSPASNGTMQEQHECPGIRYVRGGD